VTADLLTDESPRDAHGFPADPTLAHLDAAIDPTLMRQVLQEHLRPLPGASYRILQCGLVRIRYRPAVRCFLQYALRLIETSTGRESTRWVTGAMYADTGRAKRIWRRARAGDSRWAATFAPFEPACFIPGLEMVIQVFPYDCRFPSLPAMMHRPVSLEVPCLGQFGSGEWRVEGWTVDPVGYRAQLSVVLRHTVQARDAMTGTLGSKRFYVKLYADERGVNTLQTLHALGEHSRSRNGSLGMVRPVAYLDDMRALILEEAPGVSLETILNTCDDITPVLRDVARALAGFNQEDLPPASRSWSLIDQLTVLEKSRVLLGWACPRLQSDVDAVARRVVAGLEEVEARPTHRDLKIDHLFVDADGITAIDLDSFAGADPLLDPALLLARLMTMPGWLSSTGERAREAATVFAREYVDCVPVGWRRRLPLHYAGALLDVAVNSFHMQRPQWRDEVAALVSHAGEAVRGSMP